MCCWLIGGFFLLCGIVGVARALRSSGQERRRVERVVEARVVKTLTAGGGRPMFARYYGTPCERGCGKPIQVGDLMWWDKPRAWHEDCANPRGTGSATWQEHHFSSLRRSTFA